MDDCARVASALLVERDGSRVFLIDGTRRIILTASEAHDLSSALHSAAHSAVAYQRQARCS